MRTLVDTEENRSVITQASAKKARLSISPPANDSFVYLADKAFRTLRLGKTHTTTVQDSTASTEDCTFELMNLPDNIEIIMDMDNMRELGLDLTGLSSPFPEIN
ncbi:hypothetical protein SARC_08979 [Sphaeroforma arctica JP610]|uniref:Uncharacterized protein n=1 Tax=Sphaeroforma arctica JP610 TaxID=667725 RepID=A0A0L0FP65_9EUKA|nr:hypothetical protein SARC_08979 [Sphaeroforma arctica JP610]KNC78600.1 hypothetical protein SARC_08979 [Sphaeroforma arctica JP610]|eukprot:XP_014152502.1 hypothetical protein SARC_08979 [Sphaeroforma arctica JP610]